MSPPGQSGGAVVELASSGSSDKASMGSSDDGSGESFGEAMPFLAAGGGGDGGRGGGGGPSASYRDRLDWLTGSISDAVNRHVGRIGYLGSFSIAVNSLTGPAMLTIPDTYQRSGIIPTTATVLLVCVLSALCCSNMANTISKVPGNSNYSKEVSVALPFLAFSYFSCSPSHANQNY